jgi:hypothetical protein
MPSWRGHGNLRPCLKAQEGSVRRDFALCKVHPKFKMRLNFFLNTIIVFFIHVVENRHVFSPSFQAFIVV